MGRARRSHVAEAVLGRRRAGKRYFVRPLARLMSSLSLLLSVVIYECHSIWISLIKCHDS